MEYWNWFLFLAFCLQGIILVYDITRQETFNNIRKWLRYVDEVSRLLIWEIIIDGQQRTNISFLHLAYKNKIVKLQSALLLIPFH